MHDPVWPRKKREREKKERHDEITKRLQRLKEKRKSTGRTVLENSRNRKYIDDGSLCKRRTRLCLYHEHRLAWRLWHVRMLCCLVEICVLKQRPCLVPSCVLQHVLSMLHFVFMCSSGMTRVAILCLLRNFVKANVHQRRTPENREANFR